MIEIQARSGNTTAVTLGDSNVVATVGSERGITLQPGESVQIRVKDVSSLYLDAVTAGEGVSFIYFND